MNVSKKVFIFISAIIISIIIVGRPLPNDVEAISMDSLYDSEENKASIDNTTATALDKEITKWKSEISTDLSEKFDDKITAKSIYYYDNSEFNTTEYYALCHSKKYGTDFEIKWIESINNKYVFLFNGYEKLDKANEIYSIVSNLMDNYKVEYKLSVVPLIYSDYSKEDKYEVIVSMKESNLKSVSIRNVLVQKFASDTKIDSIRIYYYEADELSYAPDGINSKASDIGYKAGYILYKIDNKIELFINSTIDSVSNDYQIFDDAEQLLKNKIL